MIKKISVFTLAMLTGMANITFAADKTTTKAMAADKALVADSQYLPKKTVVTPNSDTLQKVGYSFGYMMGDGNKDSANDLMLDAYFQGFRDAYIGNAPALTEAQIKQVLLDYQKTKEAEYAKQVEQLGQKNLEQGKAYLKQHAKQSGVTTTKSGLQYKILTNAKGKKPTIKDTVVVHYEGRLIDGTVFDSSYKRGEPSVFPLDQVIDGWGEGLQLMSVGSKYQFVVPANLAYGASGNVDIEPNSVLIFEVELLEVNPKAKQ